MKTAFVFPSCNYNIALSKKDLENLLQNKHITITVSKTPCSTSRAIWNGEKEKMEILEKKAIPNNLMFDLSEPVLDIHEGPWCVQFLDIGLDETGKA